MNYHVEGDGVGMSTKIGPKQTDGQDVKKLAIAEGVEESFPWSRLELVNQDLG